VYGDVSDISAHKYHNGETDIVELKLASDSARITPNQPLPCTVFYRRTEALKNESNSTIVHTSTFSGAPTEPQKAELLLSNTTDGTLHIFLNDKAPPLWNGRLKAQKSSDYLSARIHLTTDSGATAIGANLSFDAVSFVNLNSVTNDGIIKYAKTAVELAIGLIGIMALWLGLMKIAEQSGLTASLARLLRPIMTRLFPDVPADHPAMGAMIMNISANMLGLANAATPLGLKAMEELNKLNRKMGTATDAMCTFLVINTSNVQLIPATVIAIRAAAGSRNPTEILGPVLIATFTTLIIGVVTVKLLAKLPFFRKQLEPEGQG